MLHTTRQEQFTTERAACLARWEGRGQIGDWGFLVHHKIPVEVLTEPIERRIDYIIANKPVAEVPIRLEWLRPVPVNRLPDELIKAGRAYVEARRAYDEAWKAYVEAGKAYGPGLLQAIHPDCPYDYEQKTLRFA